LPSHYRMAVITIPGSKDSVQFLEVWQM
jgi:hypothetical protein